MKTTDMTLTDATLWQKIKAFEWDDEDASMPFSDRLARDNGWELGYAIGAIEEYRRFMYLICISHEPLTPSDQVDQVWHLHLLYTRNYWQDWCKDTLGREVHHGPTKGGRAESSRFANLYQRTLEMYDREFGAPPPSEWWPPVQQRFGDTDFARVNRRTHWIFPKPFQKWTSQKR